MLLKKRQWRENYRQFTRIDRDDNRFNHNAAAPGFLMMTYL